MYADSVSIHHISVSIWYRIHIYNVLVPIIHKSENGYLFFTSELYSQVLRIRIMAVRHTLKFIKVFMKFPRPRIQIINIIPALYINPHSVIPNAYCYSGDRVR